MNYEIYHIPTNFTDAGRVMGLFELRNLVETVILTVPVLYLCIAFLPFALYDVRFLMQFVNASD